MIYLYIYNILTGNEDKSGSIDRKILQEVISQDYNLTIDLNV